MDITELENRIRTAVRHRLVADGLLPAVKVAPAFAMTPEQDEEDKRRIEEQTRELEARLGREREEHETREGHRRKRLRMESGLG